MSLNTGTPKNINFSFETNRKLMVLGVPILKHFRVDTELFFVNSTNVKVYNNYNNIYLGEFWYVPVKRHFLVILVTPFSVLTFIV